MTAHDVVVDGRRLLFHIPTTGLFDLDPLGAELLDLAREKAEAGGVRPADLEARFSGRYSVDQVIEVVNEFLDLDVLIRPGRTDTAPSMPRVDQFPLSTIVLNVTTGCNLSCSYCYKEDLDTPAASRDMDYETACRSVDLLLKEATGRDRVNVVFFGGEPLRRFPFIRDVVDYAEEQARAVGKSVDFSVTTNATLLTEAIVDYLDAHRFSLAISIDGPKALHDRNRLTVGGKGSYDVVAQKVRMALARYTAKPVAARVTLTAGVTDVEAIHRHLRDELGFAEVGYAPVTSGDVSIYNLSAEELAEVFAGFKRLGEAYLAAALEGRNTGFANLHQLMTDLYEGTRKALPCGAGVGLLAVDHEGGLNLCHRFTGSDLPTYGSVERGIARQELGDFLTRRLDKTGTGCATCRIRSLCAGGCYHESYARYGDPQHPTYHYCDLMRDWVDFGISVYARIMAENPGFFDRHITPRGGHRGVASAGIDDRLNLGAGSLTAGPA
ncbi:MAG: quinohemoprotein amine dehydrogenase maturation protein [Alphaproteobacteria bacterium]|nr:MAG: quinohemoprotein amine dehydrogenase maturation protein [Alphaproteobacteria bacterium]